MRASRAACRAGGFLVGLSSVYWREAWKYGERAFRYCQHDAGHAIGALRIAAATLGWSARVLDEVSDASIEALLGLDRAADFEGAERETAELVMAVTPGSISMDEPRGRGGAGAEKAALVRKGEPAEQGRPRALGGHRCRFRCVAKAVTVTMTSAAQIIRQRRSLLACDGKTSIPAQRFYRMLGRVMPRAERPLQERPTPWDAIGWAPAIHFGLFVHRVDGVEPGLYALARDPAKVDEAQGRDAPAFRMAGAAGLPG